MKRLIRNILNEEIRISEQGNLNSQEEYDDAVDKAREERESFRSGPEFEKRVRVMMNQMRSIPNLDSWVADVKEYGMSNMYYRRNSYDVANSVYRIMDFFGGSLPEKLRRTVGTNEFTYLMTETFFVNGGYDRDFKSGELKLPSITIYDIGATVSQNVVEIRRSFGNVIGAKSKEEAIKMYEAIPLSWEQDSEHSDTDYGDVISVTAGEVGDETVVKIVPEMIGL